MINMLKLLEEHENRHVRKIAKHLNGLEGIEGLTETSDYVETLSILKAEIEKRIATCIAVHNYQPKRENNYE